MNVILVVFVAFVMFMWLATAIDKAFNMGWGWDGQILWLGPPMVLFAVLLRFVATAIFKFVGRNP
jgi:hypothetical protein